MNWNISPPPNKLEVISELRGNRYGIERIALVYLRHVTALTHAFHSVSHRFHLKLMVSNRLIKGLKVKDNRKLLGIFFRPDKDGVYNFIRV